MLCKVGLQPVSFGSANPAAPNRQILQDDFKKCRIDNLPLEEIGRRALHIRDVGFRRVDLKNALAELVNDPVREVKQDHISEEN